MVKDTKESLLSNQKSNVLDSLKDEIKKDTEDKVKKHRRTKAEMAEEQSKVMGDLLTPENFESLVKLPSESLYALTGWDGWLLRESEVKAMSVNTSVTAKYWLTVDPKWVALTLLLLNISFIYGTRTVAYHDQKKKQKDNKEKHDSKATA